MSKIYFSNAQIRVVSFQVKHLTQVYINWLNDIEVVRFSEQRHHTHTLESCTEYFNQQQVGDDLFLAIEALEDTSQKHLGNIGVAIDKANRYADISILIGEKNYWGKGIAFEAIKGMIIYLREEVNINQITCGAMSCNIGMIKVMEKLGMNPKTTIPNRFIIDGDYHHLVQGCLSR